MTQHTSVDQLAINTIRTLAIDAIEKANSGHPGMPMGAAPMAHVLWSRFMKVNPRNPQWINRDRFVLSAGHGSMLLYAMLHLMKYDVSLEDIHNFRQWGSKTPGHPEYGHTPGVDATTGPLGQGIAMAVGMAMAEKHLAAVYNRDGFDIVDHYTYVICGDGDLMEGVSSEASSLAGHLKLGKLIVLYDSNDISLDGELSRSFSENVAQRYQAYGWQYLRVEDGNDLAAIEAAIAEAKQDLDRPTLIEVKTVIGYGSPNKGGSNASHGAPLGKEEVKLTKANYQWPHDAEFHVPAEVADYYAKLAAAGEQAEAAWRERFAEYAKAYPELARQFQTAADGQLPAGWDSQLPTYEAGTKLATRAASGNAINALAKTVPYLFGGSADLAHSNNTMIKEAGNFLPGSYDGRNIWFGVREFAMGAALNGMALHGGLKVYGGTFFVFSDYLRPAIRLSALMKQPVVYVFTHDSIAVGEDGPTHEPIEQLASLRAMPGLTVLRPADAVETNEAWKYAISRTDEPVILVLTRQNLPVLNETIEKAAEGVGKGAYVLADAPDGNPQLVLIATGSEVSLCMQAREVLAAKGIQARVVSMPSWELFERQPQEYRDAVIPPTVKARLAVEMASPLGWERYVGDGGKVLGINQFGASAPGERIMTEYGFTVDNVVAEAEKLLK
ncbi:MULTISPECIES: transketolase [Bacillales]|jgi:transketolase|uniref:Transketolase n=1 Tax=Brevibacillus aydinogluensis TaxID=927786 RepID=A0AA48M7C5_9BACL|nr:MULTISPECIES: transketolase [Bacillales]MBR8661615.1 transketolase [Brevibacillus sp. NL20B1]MDT3415925.1 transketolase [Brevibacillus aydinogluensis]NNV04619.1 transketolase [Brevibacillus sp. MCWH]UFJ61483.1 transketolase [Anoxybacillus sediminis]CAJ1001651.1 transketolase [Brevibacillus aydinogluensis]